MTYAEDYIAAAPDLDAAIIEMGRKYDQYRVETYKGDTLGTAVMAPKTGLKISTYRAAAIYLAMEAEHHRDQRVFKQVQKVRESLNPNYAPFPKGDAQWTSQYGVSNANKLRVVADLAKDPAVLAGRYAKTYADAETETYTVRFDAVRPDDQTLIFVEELTDEPDDFLLARANVALQITGFEQVEIVDYTGTLRATITPNLDVLAKMQEFMDYYATEPTDYAVDPTIEKLDEVLQQAAVIRNVAPEQIWREYAEHQDVHQLFVVQDGETLRPLIALDFETAGTDAVPRIIDIGALYYADRQVMQEDDALLGLPAAELTSPLLYESIHHISADMLQGKPLFETVAPKSRLHTALFNGNCILMAHNAAYEIDKLSKWMPGFKEAYDAGEIPVIDTMYLSMLDNPFKQAVAPAYRSDTLDAYAHRWGGLMAGEDELHRAYEDARIMLHAFTQQMGWIAAQGGQTFTHHTDLLALKRRSD